MVVQNDLTKTSRVLEGVKKDSMGISADLKVAASHMDRLHASCGIPHELVQSSLNNSASDKREVLFELWEDMKDSRVPTMERLGKQLEKSIDLLLKAILEFELRLRTVQELD